MIADSAAGFAGSPTWVADVPVNWNGTLLLYSHGFGPLTALESRMLHGTTKPQVTALRRTLTTCHANLAPGQPRLP